MRLPFLEASTLPPWCYTSEEFYQREVDRIFGRAWNFVGREDQIPHPGDYFTLEMFGESFILIRDRSGSIHAFAESLRDCLGDLPEQFSSYRFSDMVCVRRKEYDLACNWKLYREAT